MCRTEDNKHQQGKTDKELGTRFEWKKMYQSKGSPETTTQNLLHVKDEPLEDNRRFMVYICGGYKGEKSTRNSDNIYELALISSQKKCGEGHLKHVIFSILFFALAKTELILDENWTKLGQKLDQN